MTLQPEGNLKPLVSPGQSTIVYQAGNKRRLSKDPSQAELFGQGVEGGYKKGHKVRALPKSMTDNGPASSRSGVRSLPNREYLQTFDKVFVHSDINR